MARPILIRIRGAEIAAIKCPGCGAAVTIPDDEKGNNKTDTRRKRPRLDADCLNCKKQHHLVII